MKVCVNFLTTIAACILFAGCGGGTPAEPAPLSSEQKAVAEREAKEVEDSEREQQRIANQKPSGKK